MKADVILWDIEGRPQIMADSTDPGRLAWWLKLQRDAFPSNNARRVTVRIIEDRPGEPIPVVVESPFKGDDWKDLERNQAYLERCLLDSIDRGETPYASHKMLTTCLDDRNPEERAKGIAAGLVWRRLAAKRVFYTDLGWSSGMTAARELYDREGLEYEERKIGADPDATTMRPTPLTCTCDTRDAQAPMHAVDCELRENYDPEDICPKCGALLEGGTGPGVCTVCRGATKKCGFVDERGYECLLRDGHETDHYLVKFRASAPTLDESEAPRG